jgi:hypothetical protein
MVIVPWEDMPIVMSSAVLIDLLFRENVKKKD